jgi:hypothetical protein
LGWEASEGACVIGAGGKDEGLPKSDGAIPATEIKGGCHGCVKAGIRTQGDFLPVHEVVIVGVFDGVVGVKLAQVDAAAAAPVVFLCVG